MLYKVEQEPDKFMTKAEKLLSNQCNRYVNGFCASLKCLNRGGYDRTNIKLDKPPDYNLATCEIHEAILQIKDLKEEIKELTSRINFPLE